MDKTPFDRREALERLQQLAQGLEKPAFWQELWAEEVEELRRLTKWNIQRIDETGIAWGALVAAVFLVSVGAFTVRDLETFIMLCMPAVVLGALTFVGVGVWSNRAQAWDMWRAVQPLGSEDAFDREAAAGYITTSMACRQHRDAVRDQGRELLGGDFDVLRHLSMRDNLRQAFVRQQELTTTTAQPEAA